MFNIVKINGLLFYPHCGYRYCSSVYFGTY